MLKRWACGGLAAISLGAVAVWLMTPATLPTVRFANGRSARVLKVSFGTNHFFSLEPVWKRAARAVLPQPLERSLGPLRQYKADSGYDSLAVFIEPLSRPGSRNHGIAVKTIFPDKTETPVDWYVPFQRPIVLANYARGEKQILIEFSDGSQKTQIQVPNPHPVRRASWTPRPWPQTNYVTGAEVILKSCSFINDYVFILLDARSLTAQPVGWMQWFTTMFDPVGNWTFDSRARRPFLPGAKSERDFRILASGVEYISAGFVPAPAAGQYQLLPPNARATNWGVQFVGFFGPGTYEVSKTFSINNRKQGLLATNRLQSTRSGWLVECADAVALSISTRAVFEVRLRERIGASGGRIFAGRRTGTETEDARVTQLFTPRLPALATNLEVEVIVRWPPAEFFVRKPE